MSSKAAHDQNDPLDRAGSSAWHIVVNAAHLLILSHPMRCVKRDRPRYENPEAKETGRAWVRYENGHEAPLEPKLGAGLMSALG